MGTYLNPGNSGFESIIQNDYVDKTGLIGMINKTIGSTGNLICTSRPRRFGKSYAEQMLCAYYDKTCDSDKLFNQYRIAGDESYARHLNKYDVIYWDMTGIKPYTDKYRDIVSFLIRNLSSEIVSQYPSVEMKEDLSATLVDAVEKTGNKFVIIIDEWDAPIRETPEIQAEYLEFLRSLFKNSGTTAKVFAAAYMTGILPIKKDGNQSAVSDFDEFSVIEPGRFADYVGFTEDEVKELCRQKNQSFSNMKRWYDGYTVGEVHSVYNPYSVTKALESGKYKSYWKKTSAAETLLTYIDMDQDGLQDTIAKLIAGDSIEVDTDSFQNDVETFTCRDDVLTLLVHLGYLTYEEEPNSYDDGDEVVGLVKIPNEEVRSEFEKILRKAKHRDLVDLVRKSDKLLSDTFEGNAEAVAKAISEVHESEYAPTLYNDEQSNIPD